MAAAVAVAMKWLVWRVVNMVLLIRGAACVGTLLVLAAMCCNLSLSLVGVAVMASLCHICLRFGTENYT